MPTKRYLCVDDEDRAKLEAILELLSRQCPELAIQLEEPQLFGQEIDHIRTVQPEGLIIDLRLNDRPRPDGTRAEYGASAISQELRARMKAGELRPFPIVLWTAYDDFVREFSPASSGYDLFDRAYPKAWIEDHSSEAAEQLYALATGYELIGACLGADQSFLTMLGLASEDEEMLDPRIGGRLRSDPERAVVHEYALYILHEVLDAPGPLIPEEILAARLGVDPAKSRDWERCKGKLPAKVPYRGAFHEGWHRWWAPALERWWASLKDVPGPLRRLSAGDRVAFLKAHTELSDLVPALPIEEKYSDRFWTVCLATGLPLDPIDAFTADAPRERTWQEPQYLSIQSVLDRTAHNKGLRVHPLERERVDRLIAREGTHTG